MLRTASRTSVVSMKDSSWVVKISGKHELGLVVAGRLHDETHLVLEAGPVVDLAQQVLDSGDANDQGNLLGDDGWGGWGCRSD